MWTLNWELHSFDCVRSDDVIHALQSPFNDLDLRCYLILCQVSVVPVSPSK
jgi:hypothetical protein